MTRRTTKKPASARSFCRQIQQALALTVRGARADSVACLLPAATVRLVYDLAGKGARARR